uniref:Uncharacterized protein n=1 Tax=Siphoviridae sp. ctYKh4 TaxID=2823586 RepID=A0A8S5LCI0_9CAUD|nr:MAG TPA: hypothetical protein [Siphoviridae sp. ctYKh4]
MNFQLSLLFQILIFLVVCQFLYIMHPFQLL